MCLCVTHVFILSREISELRREISVLDALWFLLRLARVQRDVWLSIVVVIEQMRVERQFGVDLLLHRIVTGSAGREGGGGGHRVLVRRRSVGSGSGSGRGFSGGGGR